nr:M1 family metallopeptidase [bacterium]
MKAATASSPIRMAPAIQKCTPKARRRFWIGCICIALVIVLGLMASWLFWFCKKGATWNGGGAIPQALNQAAQGLDSYDMKLVLDADNMSLTGTLNAHFTSHDAYGLNEIVFHLYPNAFSDEDTLPLEAGDISLCYPLGFNESSIRIQNPTINGQGVSYAVGSTNNTVLRLMLDTPLKDGQSCDIAMDFTVKLPLSCGRFGYGPTSVNLCNFYPQLAFYDGKQWRTDAYTAIGDPFYSACANYTVELTAPEDYKIASSGICTLLDTKDGASTWRFDAPAMRDFALCMSKSYQVSSRQVGDTTVFSFWHTQASGEAALNAASEAIRQFSERLGNYPYPTFCVAQSNLYFSGMEYPGLVLIDGSYYTSLTRESLEYVVMHETAHQWFYSLVGNDQIKEAWLDEGFAEYMTLTGMSHWKGKLAGNALWSTQAEQLLSYAQRNFSGDMDAVYNRMDFPISDYPSTLVYNALVYAKGALMLRDLADELTPARLDAILKAYVQENAFGVAHKEDFLDTLNRLSESDYTQWLQLKLNPSRYVPVTDDEDGE